MSELDYVASAVSYQGNSVRIECSVMLHVYFLSNLRSSAKNLTIVVISSVSICGHRNIKCR